ncbi:MAG: RAMP superfamily CRISPR-associated protein [Cyanobacteria bacterium J06555_13]
MYTAPLLVQLLSQQSAQRTPDLFKQGTFQVKWRAKVGSFPAPDTETIISAGEPCGYWPWSTKDFAELDTRPSTLPLRCFIPASSIRGVVRSWAKQRPSLVNRMNALLGQQNQQDDITPGKIEFLDAWPVNAITPTLDVVTPQEKFQVFHDPEIKSQPHALYTFGDGKKPVDIVIAIRGIPGKTTTAEVEEVWQWVQQAMQSDGIGSRTSSGYGALSAPEAFSPAPNIRGPQPNYVVQRFSFQLFSQGCYGADSINPELRPTHWRGWLRSWLLRFFLGVMSEKNAQKTVAEIMGSLGENERATKGKIKIVLEDTEEGRRSQNFPYFYKWQGDLMISGPKNILNGIVLPIMRFAATLGGLGRGWRRPLHYYKNLPVSRGSQLNLYQLAPNRPALPWQIRLQPEDWPMLYSRWQTSVQSKWPHRVSQQVSAIQAEVFSPTTCAIYAVPGPDQTPIDFRRLEWLEEDASYTRGDGLGLIYKPQYKRKRDVGGDAASGKGSSHCSWVSIQQVQQPHPTAQTKCQEIVCLFMGKPNNLRQQFLADLRNLSGSTHLFGLT